MIRKNNATPVGASIARPLRMNQRGITLISLIVTIIIMLILAGIVLNLTIGERGIFKTAQNASKEYEIERIKEEVNLAILDLSSKKLAEGEKLTVEEALIGIQEKEVFEEIDLAEDTGICEGYVIWLGYDTNGNVIILDLEKDKAVRIQVSLEPKGYTNKKVEATISIKASNQKITKLEIPEGLIVKEEGKYEIEKNGTYVVKATLENGEEIEKEIKVAQIDKLAPKAFTIEAEETGTGFKIKGETEDAEADEENVKSGIDHYEYYVNGELQEGNELNDLSSGTYKVYAVAYDKAGNASLPTEEIEVKISTKIKNIKAGYRYSFFIDESDRLIGTGRNADGQMGVTSEPYLIIPTIIKTEAKFKEISAGHKHIIALDENGELWTWGNNEYGQLGNGSTTNNSTPTKIETEAKFKEISAGNGWNLALDDTGILWTWGDNRYGNLGNGTGETYVAIPTRIETEVKFKKVSAGVNHSLALDENGKLWTWGNNQYGKLGNGTENGTIAIPTKIETEAKFKEISAGWNHSVLLDENGKVWSCGRNQYGELGNGTEGGKITILTNIEADAKFKEISAGNSWSLALDESGRMWSWGNGNNGRLGNGTENGTITIPTKIETEVKIKNISAGDIFGIALDINGDVYTWGSNSEGQLGNNLGNITVSVPTRIEI